MIYAICFVLGMALLFWGMIFNQVMMLIGLGLLIIPIIISDIKDSKHRERIKKSGVYHSYDYEHKADRGHRWGKSE